MHPHASLGRNANDRSRYARLWGSCAASATLARYSLSMNVTQR